MRTLKSAEKRKVRMRRDGTSSMCLALAGTGATSKVLVGLLFGSESLHASGAELSLLVSSLACVVDPLLLPSPSDPSLLILSSTLVVDPSLLPSPSNDPWLLAPPSTSDVDPLSSTTSTNSPAPGPSLLHAPITSVAVAAEPDELPSSPPQSLTDERQTHVSLPLPLPK